MWVGRGLEGLGVGLQVDVGLCGLLNITGVGTGAALWTAFPLLLLSARSRLKNVFIRKCHISLTAFKDNFNIELLV